MRTLALVLMLSSIGCQKRTPADDYVLIEFAAHLEEHDQRLSSRPGKEAPDSKREKPLKK